MAGFLKNWTQNIAMMVCLMTLLEFILPHQKYRGMIRFVMGILLIITVISPLLSLGKIEISADDIIKEETTAAFGEKISEGVSYEAQVTDIFFKNMEDSIKNYVEQFEEISEAKVTVKGAAQKNKNGEVPNPDMVEILVKPDKTKVKKVRKVDLKQEEEPEGEEVKALLPEKEIKDGILHFYGIAKEKVMVKFWEER